MKRLAIIICLSLTLLGCGDGAQSLYDTAQFEELQNNNTQARKLYDQIVKEHPESPYAAKARQRLARLRKTPEHIR